MTLTVGDAVSIKINRFTEVNYAPSLLGRRKYKVRQLSRKGNVAVLYTEFGDLRIQTKLLTCRGKVSG